MEKFATETLKMVQENLGIVITVLISIIAFLAWYIHKTYMRMLDAKEKEIERLYEDNQRLQEILIPGLKKLGRKK